MRVSGTKQDQRNSTESRRLQEQKGKKWICFMFESNQILSHNVREGWRTKLKVIHLCVLSVKTQRTLIFNMRPLKSNFFKKNSQSIHLNFYLLKNIKFVVCTLNRVFNKLHLCRKTNKKKQMSWKAEFQQRATKLKLKLK